MKNETYQAISEIENIIREQFDGHQFEYKFIESEQLHDYQMSKRTNGYLEIKHIKFCPHYIDDYRNLSPRKKDQAHESLKLFLERNSPIFNEKESHGSAKVYELTVSYSDFCP